MAKLIFLFFTYAHLLLLYLVCYKVGAKAFLVLPPLCHSIHSELKGFLPSTQILKAMAWVILFTLARILC